MQPQIWDRIVHDCLLRAAAVDGHVAGGNSGVKGDGERVTLELADSEAAGAILLAGIASFVFLLGPIVPVPEPQQ